MNAHCEICRDVDRYECWQKRYELTIDATSTIHNAVIEDGGPCLCLCHQPPRQLPQPGSIPLMKIRIQL